MSQWFAIAVVLLVLLYSLALFAFLENIASSLLGTTYAGAIGSITLAWCVYLGVHAIRVTGSTAVQARRDFQKLFFATAAGGFLALFAAAVLAFQLGIAGAVIGMVVGESVVAVVLWRTTTSKCKRSGSLASRP